MVQIEFKVAEVEVTYKQNFKSSERVQITKSEDAYKLFLRTWNMGRIEMQEEFKMMLLDRSNKVFRDSRYRSWWSW